MSRKELNRRSFLAATTALGMTGLAGVRTGASAQESSKPRRKVERLGIGAIGMRYQGSVVTLKAAAFGDVVAVCDVDRDVRDQAKASFNSEAKAFEDYRDLLKRPEVDVVVIATPDHWHTKMLMDACRAGKDVYCEKPLTLTIDEGKQLRKVVKETGRIVQVGSWQRSDDRYRLAAEMVRAGRIGKLEKVEIVLGKNPVGGPFAKLPVPKNLNWDLWQGQTPDVPYLQERTHYTFRWWYEYSGGKMTDWGAHHVDIGQWAIDSLPIEVTSEAKLPSVGSDSYNVAIDFSAKYRYANGVEMTVSDTGRNGVLFHGSEGKIFVNRGTIAGKAVDALASSPLKREGFRLYNFDNLERPERFGKLDSMINHVGNFFDCIHAHKTPISDIESQHRSATTCHLANISMRLGRPLKWDPDAETFLGDAEANAMLRREQRAGYETALS
jgi:myo-inositol 2-dehydrogenase / D-chiro-inositol 1-dehydrogenase